MSALTFDGVSLRRSGRLLWSDLDLSLEPGRLLAVMGPNGAGKSSLLEVVLGLLAPTSGEVRVNGRPARRADRQVGYLPQQTGFDVEVPLRGEDLVRFGVDGHRWGLPSLRRSPRVDELLRRVEAEHLARVPVGRLSGGEQQRLRLAQALASEPAVLLCDEPLSALDARHRANAVGLLDGVRRDGAAVVVVTHDINPLLAVTDLVLFVHGGRCLLGTPNEVLLTEPLSDLYGTRIEVVRRGGQVAVLGADVGRAA